MTKPTIPTLADDLICFSIYSASHAINRAYKPLLKELGLTYPQYIVLTNLWNDGTQTVSDLCQKMRLDTGTITPLLKRLERLGHIKRMQGKADKRQMDISLTSKGRELRNKSKSITACIIASTEMKLTDLSDLVQRVTKLRDNVLTNTN